MVQKLQFYANRFNFFMNIKLSQDYQTTLQTKSSKKQQCKPVKSSFRSPSKYLGNKQRQKNELNAKRVKKTQKIGNEVKSPLSLKRQNTQNSRLGIMLFQKGLQSQEGQKQNVPKQRSKRKQLKVSKKINSDEQSTNIHRYNKQQASQQQDPYKITSTNPFYREKSIQPSRDFSITLMCNIQQKPKPNSHKISEKFKISINQSPSIHDLKAQINKKLNSFKSLTKLHEQQSEYFSKKVGISNEQQKRLEKIQQIEINSAKRQIFQLRDQIELMLPKAK